jgi:hypothetical protein
MRKLLYSLLFVLLSSGTANAASNQLPEVMVRQATVMQNNLAGQSVTYYGGFTGNEVILNHYVDTLLGFDQLRLDSSSSCYSQSLASGIPLCFMLEPSTGAMDLLHSRTSVDGAQVTEVAALLYGSHTSMGDVYSKNDFLKNFAFWGNNLGVTGSSNASDAKWQIKDYTLNSEAQSSWGTDINTRFKNKLAILSGEGARIANSRLNTQQEWYLQANDSFSGSSDIGNTPEGKIWRAADNDLDLANLLLSLHRYHNKGTIIVNGDLTIPAGMDILPANADTDHLGIIVLGDVNIGGNNDSHAEIFAQGIINLNGSNINMIGSFAAGNFSLSPGSNNVRFNYDYNLSRNWPPGFRDLEMPAPQEK